MAPEVQRPAEDDQPEPLARGLLSQQQDEPQVVSKVPIRPLRRIATAFCHHAEPGTQHEPRQSCYGQAQYH